MADLYGHPILKEIAEIRANLKGTDFPEDIEKTAEWEKRAVDALAILTLKNNVGVAMLLEKAYEEIEEIDAWLLNLNPEALDATSCQNLVGQIIERQHLKKVWKWLVEKFAESEKELEIITSEVEHQRKPEEGDEDDD